MTEFVEHILVPTDFSEAAWLAFRRACDLGRPLAARLTLLHVKPTSVPTAGCLDAIRLLHSVLRSPPTKGGVAPTLWPQIAKNDPAQRQLADIAESDWSLGVEIDTLLSQGDVAVEILRTAADRGATLIVMGARSPSTGRGKVTEVVLRQSTCPVMIVPRPLPHRAKKQHAPPVGVS